MSASTFRSKVPASRYHGMDLETPMKTLTERLLFTINNLGDVSVNNSKSIKELTAAVTRLDARLAEFERRLDQIEGISASAPYRSR